MRAGDTFQAVATAYGPPWNALNGTGITSTGVQLGGVGSADKYGGYNIAAVDPRAIPYGSTFTISPSPVSGAVWLAADTGGAFKVGRSRVDLFLPGGRPQQNGWGKRPVVVTMQSIGTGPGDSKIAAAKANKSDSGGGILGTALNAGAIPIVGAGTVATGAVGAVTDLLGGAASDAASTAGAVASAPLSALKLAREVVGAIFDADTWYRIGKTLGGSVVTVVGLVALAYVALNTFSPKTADAAKQGAKAVATKKVTK